MIALSVRSCFSGGAAVIKHTVPDSHVRCATCSCQVPLKAIGLLLFSGPVTQWPSDLS